MANNLESRIQEIIARATAEIAGALRGGKSASAAPKRRGRPPGRKSAAWAPVAKAAKAPLPAKAPKARRAKGGRRSSAQVVADDAKLLDYIKSHGGQRSEEIQKGLGLPKTDIASGLQRLREGGKVKMKGVKRGATYTAA